MNRAHDVSYTFYGCCIYMDHTTRHIMGPIIKTSMLSFFPFPPLPTSTVAHSMRIEGKLLLFCCFIYPTLYVLFQQCNFKISGLPAQYQLHYYDTRPTAASTLLLLIPLRSAMAPSASAAPCAPPKSDFPPLSLRLFLPRPFTLALLSCIPQPTLLIFDYSNSWKNSHFGLAVFIFAFHFLIAGFPSSLHFLHCSRHDSKTLRAS